MTEITLPLQFFRFLNSWFAVSSTCTCGEEPTPPPCWRRHPWPLSYPGSPAPPAQYTQMTGSSWGQKKYDWPREKLKKTKNHCNRRRLQIWPWKNFIAHSQVYSDDPILQSQLDPVPTKLRRTCRKLKQLGKVRTQKSAEVAIKSWSTVDAPSLCRVPA